jgi:hypothetical protein
MNPTLQQPNVCGAVTPGYFPTTLEWESLADKRIVEVRRLYILRLPSEVVGSETFKYEIITSTQLFDSIQARDPQTPMPEGYSHTTIALLP